MTIAFLRHLSLVLAVGISHAGAPSANTPRAHCGPGLENQADPSRRDAHVERALRVPLDRRSIVEFLIEEVPEVGPSENRLRLWFARLYATFVPHVEPTPGVHGDRLWCDHHAKPNKAADRRVLKAWQIYIFDLTGVRLDLPSITVARPIPPVRLRTRIVDHVPLEIEDVADEPRSIIAFFANRYRHISLREPEAMRHYILTFRAEFRLPPRPLDLAAQDVRMAFYQFNAKARQRVRTAWNGCLEDLAALDAANSKPARAIE